MCPILQQYKFFNLVEFEEKSMQEENLDLFKLTIVFRESAKLLRARSNRTSSEDAALQLLEDEKVNLTSLTKCRTFENIDESFKELKFLVPELMESTIKAENDKQEALVKNIIANKDNPDAIQMLFFSKPGIEKRSFFSKYSQYFDISQFLETDVQKLKNGPEFYKKLMALLPGNSVEDFFCLTRNEQCNIVYQKRQSPEFLELLLGNWRLAALFLNKLIKNASNSMQQQILSSRLGGICKLNNMRKEMIPDYLRSNMSIEAQQRIIVEALNRHRKPAKPEVVMPNVEEGQRTIVVQKAAEEEKLSSEQQEQYENLTCPLSLELFKNPVKVVQDGHTYYFENDFIIQALAQKQENPINRTPMQTKDLKPAPEKLKEVNQFKDNVYANFKQDNQILSPLRRQGGQ